MSSSSSKGLTRRQLLTGSAAVGVSSFLSACTSAPPYRVGSEITIDPRLRQNGNPAARPFEGNPALANFRAMYGSVVDEGYVVPAVPIEKIDPRFLRQVVPDPTGERPGTIVVDTSSHHLYLVREGGEAVRYGVGLGRAGFEWSGRAVVQWKRKWPTWTPPEEMIARDPKLVKYSAANGGMSPGLENPLGARALYIFQNGEDTLYRLHGSPEWWSIGKSVSSGCVRLMNQDIIDLYDRVPPRTPILVI